tara:strand:- start:86 stop:556 length:471 start_codon:yes stop_codon:yes gene_type:complete
MKSVILFFVLFLGLILFNVNYVYASELSLSNLCLEVCDKADPNSAQPKGYRSGCYILKGNVENTGVRVIDDVDVFAFIYDASDEEILPNRPRIGSLKNVIPGKNNFAVRVAVPSFAKPPFIIKKAKALKAVPVPTVTNNDFDDDTLPLERSIGDIL